MKTSVNFGMQRDFCITVVIQSRLSSTRLPAKALLPIAGISSVLLSALRAANTGLDVVVATSDESVDDSIVAALEKSGVKYFRGPQDDVLRRFVLATVHLNDRDIVVRLTADNVFPDGEFVESLVQQFVENASDYLGTSSPMDGLPYGLSGEVFTVGILRMADREANTQSDREHVTPWIRRHSKAKLFKPQAVRPQWSRLRCTLDSFDDYCRLANVFLHEQDPVNVHWGELVVRLEESSPDIGRRCPFKVMSDGSIHSELTLGTAQLGMDYGIANKSGMPPLEQSRELLEKAIEAGITALDTARAYGESESRIGRLLSSGYRERVGIVTKLALLDELPEGATPALVRKLVDESVFHSCHNLHVATIETLLLHRWDHYKKWGGAVWGRLQELKESGVIRRLGVSVYQPAEVMEVLKDPDVSHIQIPINLLDWRWRTQDFLDALTNRPDMVWHARSVLLQGLILLPPERWPRIPDMDAIDIIKRLDGLVRRFGREDRADLCIAYVRSLPWVTSLVVGMEDVTQLTQNLNRFQFPALSQEQQSEVNNTLPHVDENLLNPALWKNYQ